MKLPSVGDTIRAAMAAYDRGDYATALRFIQPLANGCVATAQYILGTMYYDGLGAPQDYAEAAKWIRKAAGQGDAERPQIDV